VKTLEELIALSQTPEGPQQLQVMLAELCGFTHVPFQGEDFYYFSLNEPAKEKAPKGKIWPSGGPIYREYWQEHEIVGETRVSWLLKHGGRVPKKGGPGIAFTAQEVDDDVWLHSKRHDIANAVRDCKDVSILRQIHALLKLP
jgi:hypothetical protein